MALRGEGSTVACPACGEQHIASYKIDGCPVLTCPKPEPGHLLMLEVPRGLHGHAYVFVRGAEVKPETKAAEEVGATTTRARRTA